MKRKDFIEYAILKAAVGKYRETYPHYKEFSCPLIRSYTKSLGGDCTLMDAIAKTYLFHHEYLEVKPHKMNLSSIFISNIAWDEKRPESEVRKEWLDWLELFCNHQMQKYADKHPIDAFFLGWFYKY